MRSLPCHPQAQLIPRGAQLEGIREDDDRQTEDRRTMTDELESSEATDGGDPDAKVRTLLWHVYVYLSRYCSCVSTCKLDGKR